MKIDFNNIPLQHLEHFKGGDLHYDARMHVDDYNRIMRGTLVPGASIGEHTHADSSEVIFILSGIGTAVCDGATETLAPGDCHYCPKGSTHTLINQGTDNLEFYAVVPNQ